MVPGARVSRRRSRSVDITNSDGMMLVQSQPLHRFVQQSISEDEETSEEDNDYEYGTNILNTNQPLSDDSSSNSSSQQQASPSILKSAMSLGNGSFHGSGMPPERRYSSYKTAIHEELLINDRPLSPGSSSSDPHHSLILSISSGAATIAAIPSSSSTRYCNTLVFTAKRRKNPFLFAVVSSFIILGVLLYTKSYATLHSALEQVTILAQERRQVREHFLNVEEDLQKLQRQMLELDQGAILLAGGARDMITSNGGSDSNTGRENVVDEMVTLQEKLRQGSSQIGSLQKHLQIVSRRDVIQKYGSGIIRIKLELEFPDEEKAKAGIGGPTEMIFEMAPLDLMPHSVYMFLEMVNAKLFDGCSFILNAMHVIKAAPLPYDGSSASQKVKAFTKRGLETVAFREYSSDFPHEQYTVGFAADGSPSFYINTEDNTDIHVGEPCFAKVVFGFDTVARLEAAPKRQGIWYRRRIGIKKAVIL